MRPAVIQRGSKISHLKPPHAGTSISLNVHWLRGSHLGPGAGGLTRREPWTSPPIGVVYYAWVDLLSDLSVVRCILDLSAGNQGLRGPPHNPSIEIGRIAMHRGSEIAA